MAASSPLPLLWDQQYFPTDYCLAMRQSPLSSSSPLSNPISTCCPDSPFYLSLWKANDCPLSDGLSICGPWSRTERTTNDTLNAVLVSTIDRQLLSTGAEEEEERRNSSLNPFFLLTYLATPQSPNICVTTKWSVFVNNDNQIPYITYIQLWYFKVRPILTRYKIYSQNVNQILSSLMLREGEECEGYLN